ncbi:MAG TPA: glycogen synthase GlgA [Myxococcaceae bacterium]|nr:glycogen synthase GlgA [Myxococcaceae bacterium]
MKILFASSEVEPFSKTGGLADVSHALPTALASRGHQLLVVTPQYRSVKSADLKRLGEIRLRFPFGEESAVVRGTNLSNRHRVAFLDHPGFYARDGIYRGTKEYTDNHRRFAFLSIGALSVAQVLQFNPEIIHLNDWQTALAALALDRGYRGTSLDNASSLLTIHNVAYQGVFPKAAMSELGLPWELFKPEGVEFYDQVNFLKAGIVFSDALTTVSPRYAQEIQTPELGFGLDTILSRRREDLYGILNGVDYREWNPGTDRFLRHHFRASDLSHKEQLKRELLRRLGLAAPPPPARIPVFAIVSRLVSQKGIDLVLQALPWILESELYVVVLGSGDRTFEQGFLQLRDRWPEKIAVKIGFDAKLAHLFEAGSDFFLMPSRYEPCGLNQMYSLRYGTVPVVRATGGLDDTVADIASPNGTGVKFAPYTASALAAAIHRALDLYADPARLDEVRRRGMKADHSWAVSAQRYEELYQSLRQRSGDNG